MPTTRSRKAAALLAAMAAGTTAAAWAPLASPVQAAAAVTRTYQGPATQDQHGQLQVTIKVKNKKITAVSVVNSPDNARSQFIQDRSIPTLRQETLSAQSAKIDAVSGATDTTQTYVQSLQGAINKARAAKTLK